jgi:hypothetical protein
VKKKKKKVVCGDQGASRDPSGSDKSDEGDTVDEAARPRRATQAVRPPAGRPPPPLGLASPAEESTGSIARLFQNATTGAANFLSRVSSPIWPRVGQGSAEGSTAAGSAQPENLEEEQVAPRALAFGASRPQLETESSSPGSSAANISEAPSSEASAAEEEDDELAEVEEQREHAAGTATASAAELGSALQPPQQPPAAAPTEPPSAGNDTMPVYPCTICPPAKTSFPTRLRLQNHLTRDHKLATEADLAPMAMVPCCAAGCGGFFSVLSNKPESTDPLVATAYYSHVQKARGTTGVNLNEMTELERAAKQADVQAHISAAGGATIVTVVQQAVDRCVILAPSSGLAREAATVIAASLPARAIRRRANSPALPTSTSVPPRNNETRGGRRSTANPNATFRRDVSAATALAAASPALGYDVTALLDFNLDVLRSVCLTIQDPPRNDEQARVLMQPCVFAWQQAAAATHSDTEASRDRFDGSISMHYLAHAVIFGRPMALKTRPYSEQLEVATRVAESPQALLEEVDDLVRRAKAATASSGYAPGGPPAKSDKEERAGVAQRAKSLARAGEAGKAWAALSPAMFADGSDVGVQRAYADLIPQEARPILPAMFEPVDGVEPFQLERQSFDKTVLSPLRKRAAGTLHDKYEIYYHIHRFGGGTALFTCFNAILAGRVGPRFADLFITLRAVILYKDAERKRVRPIGIGEALRRLVLRCLAQQERGAWSEWFTSILPEREADRQHAIAEAVEDEEVARLRVTNCLGGETEACEAAADHKRAEAAVKTARELPNFPANYFCHANGGELVVHTVAAMVSTHPTDPVGSDDKRNMYGEVERSATLECLRDRPEFQKYIPIFRVLYGHGSSRIFLARENGAMVKPALDPGELLGGDIDDDDRAGGPDGTARDALDDAGADELVDIEEEGAEGHIADLLLRLHRGFPQGCPLSTFFAILPMHMALHDAHDAYPNLRSVAYADDTYVGDSEKDFGDAFEHVRRLQKEQCNLESNTSKLKAFVPCGGVAGVPDYIIEAQGGELLGFMCVGGVVGRDTPEADAWKIEQLSLVLAARLAPLDRIDRDFVDSADGPQDSRQIRMDFIRNNAMAIARYWARILPPHIAGPAIAAESDTRLRTSLEQQLVMRASPSDIRERAHLEARLPPSMGGLGVGGQEGLCPAAFTASVLACWGKLRKTCPALADVDFANSEIPMVREARKHYESLCTTRDRIGGIYAELDETRYYPIDGDEPVTRHHPKSLPPDSALPSISELFDPDATETKKPPAQRALCFITHNERWLAAFDADIAYDARHGPQRSGAGTSDSQARTMIVNRETTRRTSTSQPGAATWIGTAYDGTFGTRMASPEFLTALQRRLGLHISAAETVQDALQAAGQTVDRLGDVLANGGEYNRRHNAVLRAFAAAIRAVAVGSIVFGDKEKPSLTAHLNSGHVLDIGEMGGDLATGGDVLIEIKCFSALTLNTATGRGSRPNGAQPATVGHLYAFGSTLEFARVKVFGNDERGQREQDANMDHDTGVGYVAEKRGDYYDAIHVKQSKVVLVLVEPLGGAAPNTIAALELLATRLKAPGAKDGTRYSYSRSGPRSFVPFHLQQLARAAVIADAKNINQGIISLKQSACSAPTVGAEAPAVYAAREARQADA